MDSGSLSLPLQPEASLSPEAELYDVLGEEVIQALVQLSHDAVLLGLRRRGAAGGSPLKRRDSVQAHSHDADIGTRLI